MDNVVRWYVKYHEEGPNCMVDPPPKYAIVIQSQKEPPTRLLFVSMNIGE